MKKSNAKMSVLLLDDDPYLGRFYKSHIEKISEIKVITETDSHQAFRLANRQIFDMLVIDAKLDYKGFEFGGLRLAEDLKPRYGANSILVISRFITAPFMKMQQNNLEFLEKNENGTALSFERTLCRKLRMMRNEQYCFVAMPLAKEYEQIYKKIKQGLKKAGLKCVRADEVPHNRSISQVIFELVNNSKMVVFLADGANPNAYYEAGFADAMNKEVIIITRSLEELKFDIRDKQVINYNGDLSIIPEELAAKIIHLRHAKPIGI